MIEEKALIDSDCRQNDLKKEVDKTLRQKSDKSHLVSKKKSLTNLLTYSPTHFKSAAFTLAEVLITLGVIGIIAALTLPAIVQNYKEKAEVNKVKKFYSTFSQALTMAIAENGTVDNWGLSASENFVDENGITDYTPETKMVNDRFISILSTYLKKLKYDSISDKDGQEGFVLADGTSIISLWFYTGDCSSAGGKCGDFYFRTLTRRRDNQNIKHSKTGDTFCFYIYKDKIVPVGLTENELKNCLNGSNLTHCTAWVIFNENMDYLHCPEKLGWNKASKCK